jgi:predicted DNA-binding WGR domain protein
VPDQKAIYKVQVEQRNAFWKYEIVAPTKVNISYGRIGTKGSESYKEFPNAYKRDLWIEKKVKEQIGKGYVKDTEEGIKKETEVAEGIGAQYKIKNVIYLEHPLTLDTGKNGVASATFSKTYDAAAGLIIELFQSWTKETEWIYLTKNDAVSLSSVKTHKNSLSYNWWSHFNQSRASAIRKFLNDTSKAVQEFVRHTLGMGESRLLSLDGSETGEEESTAIVTKIKAQNIGGSMIGEQVLLSFAGLGDRMLEL